MHHTSSSPTPPLWKLTRLSRKDFKVVGRDKRRCAAWEVRTSSLTVGISAAALGRTTHLVRVNDNNTAREVRGRAN